MWGESFILVMERAIISVFVFKWILLPRFGKSRRLTFYELEVIFIHSEELGVFEEVTKSAHSASSKIGPPSTVLPPQAIERLSEPPTIIQLVVVSSPFIGLMSIPKIEG